MKSQRKSHWEKVYFGRAAEDLSWYQDDPRLSLNLIIQSGVDPKAALIDIGGGASTLVDRLLDRGFEDLTVLDISGAALNQARSRLGAKAARVEWVEADVMDFLPPRRYALWHDRAAFHFLTAKSERRNYLRTLDRSLDIGGSLVISTFSLEGPRKCSGLEIIRYDAHTLGAELGKRFKLEQQAKEIHLTPAGGEQRFGFYRFIKVA